MWILCIVCALWILCIVCALGAGCGKKGAPLPPLVRLPVAPTDLSATRIEDTVYVRFGVPTANIDGVSPADVARVEIYAFTAEREPPPTLDAQEVRELATLIAAEDVRRPPPPLPPVTEGMPPVPLPPPGPGVDQGATIVVREVLTPETRVPITFPDEARRPADENAAGPPPGPLVAPAQTGPRRFYYAVARSSRGRYGPPTAFVPAPLGVTSSAPPEPEVVVDETSVTIQWTPAADARGVVEPTPEGLLPARPVVPGPPPTTYDVYEVARESPPPDAPVMMPTPLTPAPVGERQFRQSGITLGTERCFLVRPVDIVDGLHVRGPASPIACASFADTFAPAPPGRLDAVATAGLISLIWEPSDAADLAGYLVLRGEAGGATLSPLMTDPVLATTFRDDAVQAGQRYVYAIVAVDTAGNRSEESNRVEETARP